MIELNETFTCIEANQLFYGHGALILTYGQCLNRIVYKSKGCSLKCNKAKSVFKGLNMSFIDEALNQPKDNGETLIVKSGGFEALEKECVIMSKKIKEYRKEEDSVIILYDDDTKMVIAKPVDPAKVVLDENDLKDITAAIKKISRDVGTLNKTQSSKLEKTMQADALKEKKADAKAKFETSGNAYARLLNNANKHIFIAAKQHMIKAGLPSAPLSINRFKAAGAVLHEDKPEVGDTTGKINMSIPAMIVKADMLQAANAYLVKEGFYNEDDELEMADLEEYLLTPSSEDCE